MEFLAAGRCRIEIAYLRFPHDNVAVVATMFHQLDARQLIDSELNPCAQLVGLINSVLEARAETADVLWGAAASGAQHGADEALAGATGQLVDAFRDLPEPVPPAWRLHHVLTGLRYARLGAHVDSWQLAGLDAAEITALSAALTSKQGHPVPAGLIARGWLTNQGTATPKGRTAREAIETETNDRCSAMFGVVGEQRTWYEALRALPSELS